eukprot:3934143-Rhodomonas_salina.1
MWSFRLKQVVRLEGPRFSHMYPFRNPEGVVNREHFTAADVKRMHVEDGDLDDVFVSSADEDEQLDQDNVPPSGTLKRKRATRQAGQHAPDCDEPDAPAERDGTDSGEQGGKDEGEQPGENAGEQRPERGTERPRAEGEKIG